MSATFNIVQVASSLSCAASVADFHCCSVTLRSCTPLRLVENELIFMMMMMMMMMMMIVNKLVTCYAAVTQQKLTQRWRAAPDRSAGVLPGAVVNDLMQRDLSDHDYELLLQLDKSASYLLLLDIY